MAYRDAWLRAQRFTPPAGQNPNLGDAVAAEQHLSPGEWQNPFDEPTPVLPSLPEYMYALDDYMLPTPVQVYDPTITEPLGHEYGTVQEGGQDEQAARIEAYHAHSADYGAAAVHHHAELVERADRDIYLTQRTEMEFPSTGSRMALVRGRNAWPENNPDGPPAQGYHIMRWIDRQFTRRGLKTDQQPLRPYRAGLAAQIPEPSADRANQYTSPFARLSNARRLKLTTPQIRRVPRPPDESAVEDGTENPQYALPAYWDEW